MKNKICILIAIILFTLVTILLSYNSFVNLSYVNKTIGDYKFMLPKEISYEVQNNMGIQFGKLSNEKISNSSLSIFSSKYELAKSLAKTYTFYDCDEEIVAESEDVLNDKRVYLIQKKLNYYDNQSTTYMFTYAYEVDSQNIFVVSVECYNEKDINYYIKKLKKTLKSVILY